MRYHIQLTPINGQGTEIPDRRDFVSIENGRWNGGGNAVTSAYRVGRNGCGTVSYHSEHIELYDEGDRARPILDLIPRAPGLRLHAGGGGAYMGLTGGRLPEGNLVWEVIQIS